MRLSINIGKRYAFMIFGVILLGIGGFFVYAVVPNPGHGDSEIESVSWSKITSRPAGLDDGDDVGPTIYSGYIDGASPSSSILPSGWVVEAGGLSGLLTVTHNENKLFNIVAMHSQPLERYITLSSQDLNSFTLQFYKSSGGFAQLSRTGYFIAIPQ